MRKRIHKALSMMPEDLERLQKLSKAAGMNESTYIRVLLLNEEARIEGRRVTSNNVGYDEKESPSGDEEGGQVKEEARFLTKKLPNYYLNVKIKGGWYWMLFKNPQKDYFDRFAANEEVERRGFKWKGSYITLTTKELLITLEEEKKYYQ